MKALALLFSAAALSSCVVYDDTYPYSSSNVYYQTGYGHSSRYNHDYYYRNNEAYRRMNEHEQARYLHEQHMHMDAQNRRMRTNETRMRHEEMHRQQQRYQQQ